MNDLTLGLIQPDIIWEDKEANLAMYTAYIESMPEHVHIIVLPEMFSTGFSMNPAALAEPMDGAGVLWLQTMARKHRKIITGSLIIRENEHFYNRLFWMLPTGVYYTYDKRHLFSYAGEEQHYTAGQKRLVVSVNGWKIMLQVCYDLRFPVWARQPYAREEKYDLLLNVANWPERRQMPWMTLLQARAIENQCFVAAVNRVGNDGNQVYHSGDSSFFGPLGNLIDSKSHEAGILVQTLHKNDLEKVRNRFGFLNDADNYALL